MVIIPEPLRLLCNPHLDALRHLLTSPCDSPSARPEMEYLFLCFTNRCGSHLVAELLASTGSFNLGGEFFNYDTVLDHVQRRRLPNFAAYFDFLCNEVSHKRRLTMKVSVTHLVLLFEAGVLQSILDRSKFIMIQRNDRLMQAISLAIASQTGQWTSYLPSRISPEELVFSPDQITDLIESTLEQQRCFDLFFAMNGIRQYSLIYEQFSSDPGLYVPALQEWLGLEFSNINMGKIRLKKQAYELSSEWRERYLRYLNRHAENQSPHRQ